MFRTDLFKAPIGPHIYDFIDSDVLVVKTYLKFTVKGALI